jgi:hypothetical protein
MTDLQVVTLPALLMSAFMLVGYALPPAAASEPAQEAAAVRPDAQSQFQAYTDWLVGAHARAAMQGEDSRLPSQF